MFYKIVKALLRGFLFFVFRMRIEGKENVLMSGGGMLAVNHKSNWDPIIVAAYCPRKLRFMSKAELFKNKFFAFVLTSLGAFPIHRGKGDVGAIKSALSILKNQEMMLIFPEGGRIINEVTAEAKPGAVLLAIKSKIPIIPAYISGKYHWFAKMTIHFGEPIYLDKYYDTKPVMAELQNISNELLKTMRSFKIPEKEKRGKGKCQ